MKAAYVGILTSGSTSRMRAETLREITPGWDWEWLDTDEPLNSTSRLSRSVAYRFQIGPAVDRINNAILHLFSDRTFDIGWIDKAVFIREMTLDRMRAKASRLIHFTPDTAFHANRSRHFEANIGKFDLLVTTKSFEVSEYERRVERRPVFLTTQGFEPRVHFPRNAYGDRMREAVFVGLAEPSREHAIASLLDNGVPVRLAGHGWKRFVEKRKNDPLLRFAGESVFGDDYAATLSKCWIGLGLLSKRFPELHTTRTFEIPACGAILATERNRETARFFTADEALFFGNTAELVQSVTNLLNKADAPALARIAEAGRTRVTSDHRDYPSLLRGVLGHPSLKLPESTRAVLP